MCKNSYKIREQLTKQHQSSFSNGNQINIYFHFGMSNKITLMDNLKKKYFFFLCACGNALGVKG